MDIAIIAALIGSGGAIIATVAGAVVTGLFTTKAPRDQKEISDQLNNQLHALYVEINEIHEDQTRNKLETLARIAELDSRLFDAIEFELMQYREVVQNLQELVQSNSDQVLPTLRELERSIHSYHATLHTVRKQAKEADRERASFFQAWGASLQDKGTQMVRVGNEVRLHLQNHTVGDRKRFYFFFLAGLAASGFLTVAAALVLHLFGF